MRRAAQDGGGRQQQRLPAGERAGGSRRRHGAPGLVSLVPGRPGGSWWRYPALLGARGVAFNVRGFVWAPWAVLSAPGLREGAAAGPLVCGKRIGVG